jgi:hypothetical protein
MQQSQQYLISIYDSAIVTDKHLHIKLQQVV